MVILADNTEINRKQDQTMSIAEPPAADATLDITNQICPMTFVRTRLALDRLKSGQTLLVKLKGDEATRNVPRSAQQLGHHVLSQQTDDAGITWLLLQHG